MLGDATGAVRRSNTRSCARRRVTVVSAVTFLLLVASALVSLSPTPSGFRTAAAGAAGWHRSAVADLVSARHVLCLASAHSPSVPTPGARLPESCQLRDAAGGVAPLGRGHTTSAPAAGPALVAYPSTLTAGANAGHSTLVHSLVGKPGTATRHLVGPHVVTMSHRDAKPANVTTKNGSSTVHIVFTQAGAERWDTVPSANFLIDVAFLLGYHVLSDPTIEPTNTSFTTLDGKVQILFGNLSAAQAHQFASSL